MRGLIAAALGGLSKGVGAVSAAQIETNSRKALLQAEEEMRLRLAEAQERMAIAAEDRAIGNIGRTAEAQAAADEDILRRRYGEGSEYGGLIQRQMEAEETPEARARRETAEFSLEQAREVDRLTKQLATETDPAKQAELRQQLTARGAKFDTAEMDPFAKANLENLKDSYQKAEEAYWTASAAGDEDGMARANARMEELNTQFQSLRGGQQATRQSVTPEMEADAKSVLNDPNASPADKQDAADILRAAGTLDSYLATRQRDVPRAAPEAAAPETPAPEAAAPAAPQIPEGYSVSPGPMGLIGRAVESAVEGMRYQPGRREAIAALNVGNAENAARSVAEEMAKRQLPEISTRAGRARAELALASGKLPPEYEATLRQYLEQNPK